MSKWNHPNQGFQKRHKTFLTKEQYKEIGLKLRGRKHTEETKKKISDSSIGKPPTKGMSGKKHSEETKRKIGKAIWKGGMIKNERNDPAYHIWVKKVKKRDKNQCAFKGRNCSGYCIVHHILPWRDYPELRYKVKNGITLCQYHHPRKTVDEQRLIPFFQTMVESKELI